MEQTNKPYISNITGGLMVGVALAVDGIQALASAFIIGVFISPFITLFAWLTFWLWFKLNGVSFGTKPKNFLVLGGGGLVELIPVLNILPGWTLSVTTLLIMNKAEKVVKKLSGDTVAGVATPKKI